MNEEILNIICKIHSNASIVPASTLQNLLKFADQSKKIVRINRFSKRIYKEVSRVLTKDGRLYFFYRGWGFNEKNKILNAGFKDVQIFRILKKYNLLINMNNASTGQGTFKEKVIRSAPFLFIIKIFPGLYIYSVGPEKKQLLNFTMKIDHRSILTALKKTNQRSPYKYLKTSRSDSRGDYPLKEKFIIDWINKNNVYIGVPKINFEFAPTSTLSMSRCNGELMTKIIKNLEKPDKKFKNDVIKVRRAIESLSKAGTPSTHSCRPYLKMLYTEPQKEREKIFENYFFGNKNSIIHGDLNPANIIVNNNTINFIDWEHWRIGYAFENWFDFIFRAIWMKIKKRKNHRSKYIFKNFKQMLSAKWINEETVAFFKNLNITDPIDQCLRYSLFLFFYDQIIKHNSSLLIKKINKITIE